MTQQDETALPADIAAAVQALDNCINSAHCPLNPAQAHRLLSQVLAWRVPLVGLGAQPAELAPGAVVEEQAPYDGPSA